MHKAYNTITKLLYNLKLDNDFFFISIISQFKTQIKEKKVSIIL